MSKMADFYLEAEEAIIGRLYDAYPALGYLARAVLREQLTATDSAILAEVSRAVFDARSERQAHE